MPEGVHSGAPLVKVVLDEVRESPSPQEASEREAEEAGVMTEDINVRQSHLNLFDECGVAYARRYIDGEIIPPGIAALRGSGVHGAAEVNHKQKKDSRRDLPRKELIDIAVATFEARKKQDGFRLTPEEMKIGVRPMIARTTEVVTALTGLYADKVAPKIQPAFTEERITIRVAKTVTMSGTLDVATVEGRVADFKTSTRARSQDDADRSLQLSQYGLLYRGLVGRFPAGFDLEQLIDAKKPRHVPLRTTRTVDDYQALINRVNVLIRSRQAGLFAPASVGSWICSPKWCGYWDTCPYVNSERRAAASAVAEE